MNWRGISLFLLLVAACDPGEAEVEWDVVESPIAAEQPGGVAERVYRWYDDDADVALRSYALFKSGSGCSGTMIGPNVMLTAAHCSGAPKVAQFRTYSTETNTVVDDFDCEYLEGNFPEGDVVLFYCAPNAAGENPGDKYGYVDFDIELTPDGLLDYAPSKAKVSSSAPVYSVWWNPITGVTSNAMLYSEGEVTNTTSTHWFSLGGDGCQESDDIGRGASADLWSNGGCSGSSILSATSHRLLLGPTSTAQSDSRGRNAGSIADYLQFGRIFSADASPCGGTGRTQINQDLLPDLGLDPAIYSGWMDREPNGLFDVHEDLESIRGENQRPWYWLGFESHRRNHLWTPMATGLEFQTNETSGLVRVNRLSSSSNLWSDALRHTRLNLKTNTTYNVSIMANVAQTPGTNPIRVCLGSTCRDWNPTVGSWQMKVLQFQTGLVSGAMLRIMTRGQSDVSLTAVSVIEAGAYMDFDTHDTRTMWRDHNTGARGFIWPNGNARVGQTGSNWAGVVRRNSSRGLYKDDWSLRNRQLGIAAGQVQVCFDHRRSTREPLTNATGTMRIIDNNGEVANSYLSFTPSANWQRSCTARFTLSQDDNNLQFGVNGSNSSASGAYLVDNILVSR